MKIETYRKGIKLKYFAIGAVVSVLLLIPLVINTTKAKYQTSQSVPLIRGTINFKPYDFKIMAMYQENDSGEYEEVEVMPDSGYVINEEDSYCYTVTQEERDDTAVLYTDDQGQHVVGNLKKSSKCYLWFDKHVKSYVARETIIANAASTTTMPSITGISTDTSNTLYTVADDDGTSYVFRGNPSNNWVSFGGYYWRIIRVNGDGSIRMIYNGTSIETEGTGTQISGTHTYSYNAQYNDNAYVGFMYGTTGASTYEATHANTYDSNVKTQLDNWYTSSGLSSYAQYIDTNAGFCNDRQPMSGVYSSSFGTLGYGTNATAYAPIGRLYDNNAYKTTPIPSLKCTNASNDLFTMPSSNKGNKALTNPVGLITSDEVVFAGGFGETKNTGYYLRTNQDYWTMSPCHMYTNGYTSMIYVHASGLLDRSSVNGAKGVRPVINLRSDVTLSGSGTSTDPYKIS